MKKFIAIGLGVAVLLVVMMACGQQTQEQEKQEQPTQEVQQSESVSPEPTVPPVETEPQDEPKASEVPEVTEPTEPVRAEDDQQAETEPVVESATKPAATPQENKPQEPPKSPTGQTETPSNSGGGDDMAAIEEAMKQKYLNDKEEAAANGWSTSDDVMGGKDFEDIGSQLNQGIQTTTPPETSGGETTQQTPAPSTQQSGTVWEQAFYDTLTPQQQEFYKNADDSTRRQMKATIEADRQLDQQGYQGNESTDPEDNREAWSHITVGG